MRVKGGTPEPPDSFMGQRKGEWYFKPLGHHVDGCLVKEKRAGLKQCDQCVYVIKESLLSDWVCLIKGLMDKAGHIGVLK